MISEKFFKATDEICDFDHHVNAPYIRREFELPFAPEKLEIVITGLGFYELYFNGHNITKGPLAPYISNPNDVVYYDTYDLLPYLKPGKNVIGILLGNGFRNPFGGFIWDFEKAACRGPLCFALALEAKAGEQTFLMEGDTGFKSHPSPITFDDVRMGCRYDARLELEGWAEAGFDDSDWTPVMPAQKPAGLLKLCPSDPIAVIEKIRPVSITHYDSLPFAYQNNLTESEPLPETVRNNVYVYDFGVNSAGITVLKIKGKPGQVITLRHGERLQNGTFSISTTIFIRKFALDAYLNYSQADVYTCRGGETEIFIPKFKYDGFRYVYVEGLEPEQATEDALEYWVMNSDVKERATFVSSSETLNKLYEMTRRSDKANLYYFPTDCPHREKNGWTGDASMSAEHMLLNLGAERTLRAWLESVRLAQRTDGALPGIVPTGGWGFKWGNGPAWDSAVASITLQLYRFTGDVSVISENVSTLMRYLTYVMNRRNEKGLIAIGLGDWVDPYEKVNKKISSPLEVTDTVMTSVIAKTCAFLFGEAGRTLEADYAKACHAELVKAIRASLVDFDTMTVAGDCQTSQAFALFAGIFTDSERPAAEKKLLELIARNNNENACGMIGLRVIFHVLCGMGYQDLAYRMITSENRTGYGSWVKRGCTAMVENFYYEDGREACSQNHHFLGDIVSVMMQFFAGFVPNPTYHDPDSFVIAPKIVSDLRFAETTFEHANGKVSVRWDRDGKNIVLRLSVPEGLHGSFVPDTGYTSDAPAAITGGEYKITMKKK